MCQNTSYALHWAICPTLEPLTNLIQEALKNILTPNKLDISQSTAKNLYIQIMNLDCLQAHYYSHKPSLFSTLSGLVPLELINTLNEYTQSTKTACFLTNYFSISINKSIQKYGSPTVLPDLKTQLSIHSSLNTILQYHIYYNQLIL